MIPGCILALYVASLYGLEADVPIEDLKREILALTSPQGAEYGVAFKHLRSGETLFINADATMHAASTMKVPVMMRLFELIDSGELRLDTPIAIENAFASIVDGSEFSITVDSDEDLYRHVGQALPLETVIEAMIVRSSNLGTNLLIDLADPKATTRLMRDFGADGIEILRGVEDLKAFEAGRNNVCSARSMLTVMIACVSSPRFSQTSRDKMLEILRGQEFNDMIPAGLPDDCRARVAHKTGSISRVQHDAAIVDLPDGTRYGLVIFCRDFGDERGRERAKATSREISRAVYDHVVGTTKP